MTQTIAGRGDQTPVHDKPFEHPHMSKVRAHCHEYSMANTQDFTHTSAAKNLLFTLRSPFVPPSPGSTGTCWEWGSWGTVQQWHTARWTRAGECENGGVRFGLVDRAGRIPGSSASGIEVTPFADCRSSQSS